MFCVEGEGGLVRALLLARCVVGGDGLLRADRLVLMSVVVCGGLRGAVTGIVRSDGGEG